MKYNDVSRELYVYLRIMNTTHQSKPRQRRGKSSRGGLRRSWNGLENQRDELYRLLLSYRAADRALEGNVDSPISSTIHAYNVIRKGVVVERIDNAQEAGRALHELMVFIYSLVQSPEYQMDYVWLMKWKEGILEESE